MVRENPRTQNPRTHGSGLGDWDGWRGAHDSFAPLPLHGLHQPLRPFVPTWCELAVTALAVMCVAPALVLGLLLLLEAALPNPPGCAAGKAAAACTAEATDTARSP
jgi:hypothetical protein